jgi:hypothetical protein
MFENNLILLAYSHSNMQFISPNKLFICSEIMGYYFLTKRLERKIRRDVPWRDMSYIARTLSKLFKASCNDIIRKSIEISTENC